VLYDDAVCPVHGEYPCLQWIDLQVSSVYYFFFYRVYVGSRYLLSILRFTSILAVIDHFELPRNVVGTCTNLLDRYLAKHFSVASANGLPVIEKKEFQLVTMSCLYLAMKAKGENRVPIEYMVQLSRGTMDKCQLEGMEMQLLTKLAWMVNPPTAFDFAEHYLHLLRPSYRNGCVQMTALLNSSKMKALVDQTAFLVELSVLDYYFVSFRPSTVALAALFNAMDEDPEVTARSRNPFSMYKNCHGFEGMILPGEEGNVFLCRQRLDSLYRNSAAGGDDQFEPESPRAATTASKSDRMTSPVSVVATLQS